MLFDLCWLLSAAAVFVVAVVVAVVFVLVVFAVAVLDTFVDVAFVVTTASRCRCLTFRISNLVAE